ncbi:MAG: hypothetical protein GY765_41605, partial [bacterium]|nr:hypothetical protein [bacterium]
MSNNQNPKSNEGENGKKVILLDRSRTERAFDEYESLWDIEINKIEDRLADHITSLRKYEDEKEPHKKTLLSIAILGYPGSGKTSTLHTLVERVKKREFRNISSLPVIKPNLVSRPP